MEIQHEMVLELTHASGMQGWYCPTCGRRILFLIPPNDSMVVVEQGDTNVVHHGSRGGLRVMTMEIEKPSEEPEEELGERLRPWIRALENLDLDW